MKELSIEHVANALVRKRGDRGIRAVAKEIGISPSTLSRIENSKMPDLKTFHRVCEWLGYDAETATAGGGRTGVSVHFKKDQAIKPETARALADLIIAAQHQLMRDLGLDPSKESNVREGT